jgi:hypothetical protein
MTAVTDDKVVTETLRALFGTGGDATAALHAFGVAEFLAEDLPTAVRSVFVEQGRAGARSDALTVLQITILERHATAFAEVGLSTSATLTEPETDVSDDYLVLGEPARVALGCRAGGAAALVVQDAGPDRLTPVTGIDADLGLHRWSGGGPAEIVLTGEHASAWWAESVAWGRIALAWELVGGARAALDRAREHAAVREQFGRPIGQFQAVAHRLAEVRVAIDAAEAVLDLADDPTDPVLAAAAKYLAGRAYESTARNCLQVLGGIGFTAEHPFDGYLRRGFALDQLLGSRTRLATAVGDHLLDRGSAPLLCSLATSSAPRGGAGS